MFANWKNKKSDKKQRECNEKGNEKKCCGHQCKSIERDGRINDPKQYKETENDFKKTEFVNSGTNSNF